MWHDEVSRLTCWTQPVEERRRKGREEEGGERSSTFSLVFLAIGSLVSVGVRGKVLPRGKSFK